MSNDSVEKVIYPKELFEMFQVKDVEASTEAFKYAFDFLICMAVGDEIHLPAGKFEKISEDLIHISPNISIDDITSTLEKKKIIKFLF